MKAERDKKENDVGEGRNKKSPGDDLLSHQWTGSIIGAGGLNFRVRNGIGCGPSAVVTRTKYVRETGEGRELRLTIY